MDKLLDKEVHQLYRNAPATSGSSNGSSTASDASLLGNAAAHSGGDCQSQNSDAVAPAGLGAGGTKDEVVNPTNMEQPNSSRTEAAVTSAATVMTKPKTLSSARFL